MKTSTSDREKTRRRAPSSVHVGPHYEAWAVPSMPLVRPPLYGACRHLMVICLGKLSWSLPGWPLRFLNSCSDLKLGSSVDMFAAAEHTQRRDLKQKYFLHALAQRKHSELLLERVKALTGGSRERQATGGSPFVQPHGTLAGRTLFERLGELEFLALVFVAASDTIEKLQIYQKHRFPDEATLGVLEQILDDEYFHVSYTGKELIRYRREGRGKEVNAALRRVRWRAAKHWWMGFCKALGSVATMFCLTTFYLSILGIFKLAARLHAGGWKASTREHAHTIASARGQS